MTNIPMTAPDGVLAIREENFGHSSSYVELENGDILHGAGLEWCKSSDGGLSWSEIFRCFDSEGDPVAVLSLVKLSGSGIGCACGCR